MAKPIQRERARHLPPAERRAQLVRAGIASFANKGIDATKHADLARACSVSVPTVFTYFPNRRALVNDILDEVGQAIIEQVVRPAQALEPAQQFMVTGPLYLALAERDPDCVKTWLSWSMHFEPRIQRAYRRYERRIVGDLARMIDPDSTDEHDEAHDRARMVLASSTYLARMVFDGESEQRREAFIKHVIGSITLGTETAK